MRRHWNIPSKHPSVSSGFDNTCLECRVLFAILVLLTDFNWAGSWAYWNIHGCLICRRIITQTLLTFSATNRMWYFEVVSLDSSIPSRSISHIYRFSCPHIWFLSITLFLVEVKVDGRISVLFFRLRDNDLLWRDLRFFHFTVLNHTSIDDNTFRQDIYRRYPVSRTLVLQFVHPMYMYKRKYLLVLLDWLSLRLLQAIDRDFNIT